MQRHSGTLHTHTITLISANTTKTQTCRCMVPDLRNRKHKECIQYLRDRHLDVPSVCVNMYEFCQCGVEEHTHTHTHTQDSSERGQKIQV